MGEYAGAYPEDKGRIESRFHHRHSLNISNWNGADCYAQMAACDTVSSAATPTLLCYKLIVIVKRLSAIRLYPPDMQLMGDGNGA